LESRGFTALEFAKFHPGGKLGAMLKHSSDLMHTGEALPLKAIGTTMSEALAEMSAKGFGCVAIVDGNGDIAGIITDGDLRRQMHRNLLTLRVEDVMTRNPKVIDRDSLASEALEMLNSARITSLIVTEANKPVGIIHLHELLRAGVA
jgi:arabinose-5-phosphate isomerase